MNYTTLQPSQNADSPYLHDAWLLGKQENSPVEDESENHNQYISSNELSSDNVRFSKLFHTISQALHLSSQQGEVT